MAKIRIGIWMNDEGLLRHGKPVNINGQDYWVNLYQEEPKTDNHPVFNIVLDEAQPRVSRDEIPF